MKRWLALFAIGVLIAIAFVVAFAVNQEREEVTSPLYEVRVHQAAQTFAKIPNVSEKSGRVDIPGDVAPAFWWSLNPWSWCAGSLCFGSGCIGSGCLGSGCYGSVCLDCPSAAIFSACVGSGCLGSGCVGSGCIGSACVSTGCVGSACQNCE